MPAWRAQGRSTYCQNEALCNEAMSVQEVMQMELLGLFFVSLTAIPMRLMLFTGVGWELRLIEPEF